MDFSEMYNLITYLVKNNFKWSLIPLYDGLQLIVYDDNTEYLWDAICHRGSYGHEEGLLEIAGIIVENENDSVEGWLTANEIIDKLERGVGYEN